MQISRAIAQQMQNSSWIRRMFETGIQLSPREGAENVFDYSIGNPDVEPPSGGDCSATPGGSGKPPAATATCPNAGYPEVRATWRRRLAERSGVPSRRTKF